MYQYGVFMRGKEQGSKSRFSLLSEPISPSSLLSEPISPSSLNVYLTVSPSSLLFPLFLPPPNFFLGHFSLLPILFPPSFKCYVNEQHEEKSNHLTFNEWILKKFQVEFFERRSFLFFKNVFSSYCIELCKNESKSISF